MYIFIQRNTFKRLPVITLAFLPAVLTGFPAARRESGGTGGCTKGIVCNSSLSYFFYHICKWVIITDVLIIFVLVTSNYNALFPHKINISLCVFMCRTPHPAPPFGCTERVCLRREPHLSRTSGPTEADNSSTHVIPGIPVYNLNHKVLTALGRRLCPAGPPSSPALPGQVQGSLLLSSSLMNMEEPSLSADCPGALFLSTTPLLSDQMSLFLLLLFLCVDKWFKHFTGEKKKEGGGLVGNLFFESRVFISQISK